MNHALIPYNPREQTWNDVAQLFREHRSRRDPERQRRIREAEAVDTERHRIESRVRELADLYGPFSWRDDPLQLQQHVFERRDDLLHRQTQITAAHVKFHEDHGLVMYLRDHRRDLYGRVQEVFEYRALALALQPVPLPAPPSFDDRLRRLLDRYGLEEFGWREDAAHLEAYAKRNLSTFLTSARREAILREHAAFHRDRAFVDFVRGWSAADPHRPNIYERHDCVFHLKVLAIAERLAGQEEPPKRPPTTEEYRRHMIARLLTRAHDVMSRVIAVESAAMEYRDRLSTLDLDPDAVDQHVELFRELLADPDGGRDDTTFKQV